MPDEKQTCLACDREFPAGISKCPADGTVLISFRRAEETTGGAMEDQLPDGTLFGGIYRIKESTTSDSDSITYSALDQWMGRSVKIVVLRSSVGEEGIRRFQRQIKDWAAAGKPGPAGKPLDFGVDAEGRVFGVFSD